MFVACCVVLGLVAGCAAPRLAAWGLRVPAGVRGWAPGVGRVRVPAGVRGWAPGVGRVRVPAGVRGWAPGVGRVRVPAVGHGRAPAGDEVRAPGVAVGSAMAAGVVGWAVGPGPAAVAFLAVAILGVPLVLVDSRHLRLPDRLLLAVAVPVTVTLAGAAGYGGDGTRLAHATLSAGAVAGGYLVLSLAPGAPLGLGDVKLAGLLGFPLGWLGWQVALAGAVLPHLLAGPVALAMLGTGRAARHSPIPFGPALLGGALLALVLRRLRS